MHCFILLNCVDERLFLNVHYIYIANAFHSTLLYFMEMYVLHFKVFLMFLRPRVISILDLLFRSNN